MKALWLVQTLKRFEKFYK